MPIVDAQKHSDAIKQCARGMASYVSWRADALDHIDAAIAADENYALPRLVKAWMLHGGRDATYRDTVSSLISDIERCLPSTESREFTLWSALKDAHAGYGIEAATALDGLLNQSPTDLLTHQLFQNELFWTGRANWMCGVVERAAPAWSESTEGYGAFLSVRAFANEEAGQLEDAERFGRMAIDIDPTDIWGAHAVAHVLMMKGEMRAGVDWLERLSRNWGHANQLRHHLWWHLCLFLLELGDFERIFDLLTTEVRNPDSPLVKESPSAAIDIQNLASLLLRLELYGVDVGEHWNILASICADRVHNHGNAFCNIHDMMVLAATGQYSKASELLDSMRSAYHSQSGSVALSYHAAGIPACEAILAHRKQDHQAVVKLLSRVRHDLSLMGASHVQRDVLFHLLVHSATSIGRDDLCAVFLDDIRRLGFCDVPNRAAYKEPSETIQPPIAL